MSEKNHAEHGSGKGHRGRHGGHAHGGSHEEHEGAPEWLISFADNVTLMMGFFVILLAMNMKEKTSGGIGGKDKNSGGAPTANVAEPSDEMLDMAIAIRAAFNNPVDPTSNDPNDQALIRRLFEKAGQSDARQDGPRGRENDVQSLRPTEYYAPCGSIPFPDHTTELSEPGRETVADIARRIRGRTFIVEVRGHASATEAFRKKDQAMQLAFDRAFVVASLLAEHGVDWWQMRLIAAGDHDRVRAFPSGEDDDRANARVEVVVTDQVVPDEVPTNVSRAGEGGSGP
jgi:flagellar motor protein MotB